MKQIYKQNVLLKFTVKKNCPKWSSFINIILKVPLILTRRKADREFNKGLLMRKIIRIFRDYQATDCNLTYLPSASCIIFSFAVIANSTRLFLLLPASVSLLSIGSAIPIPVVVNRVLTSPLLTK